MLFFIIISCCVASHFQCLYIYIYIYIVDRLHKFAEDNDLEGVASLLKQGIDPNTKEEEVKNCFHVLELIFLVCVMITGCSFQHGRTAIHRAAKEGNMKVVELLLEFGADVDARAKVTYYLDIIEELLILLSCLTTCCSLTAPPCTMHPTWVMQR